MANDAPERPTIERQMVFGTDGIEPDPEAGPAETSLEDYGADVDHRDRVSRVEGPGASAFGVDDRPVDDREGDSEQASLFLSADDAQRTLDDEAAARRTRFSGGDEAPDDG